MSYEEACELVAGRLRIVHPYGVAGRLPWQGDDEKSIGWGVESPENIVKLSKRIFTASQRAASRQFSVLSAIRDEPRQTAGFPWLRL